MSSGNRNFLTPEKFRFVWKDSKETISRHEFDNYCCPSCGKLLVQAMQKECGHRICLQCSRKFAGTSKPCVVCQAPSEENDNPDFAFRRDIRNRILAVCPNQSSCGWSGQVEDIKAHIEECTGGSNMCEYGCGTSVDPVSSSQHYQTCSFRPTACEFCSAPLKDFQRQEHFLKDCTTHYCFGCSKKFPNKDDLQSHVMSCRNAQVPCPMYVEGCHKWIHVSEVSQHVFNPEHMLMLIEQYRTLQNELKQQLLLFYEDKSKLSPKTPNMVTNSSATSSMVPDEASSDVRRRVESVISEVEEVRSDIKRLDRTVKQLSTRVDILEVRSCTGVFVWKIDNVRRRVRDAENGTVVSLYSPPFSTSEHGYKMCLRAYLNGDGAGKGEYVSLFLVIMQSDHDDLLSWPFAHKVAIYILDQKSTAENSRTMKQTFMPGKSSASFKKPSSSFNLASGFPRFAHKRILDEQCFVDNDILYVKCHVDRSNMKDGPDFKHS